MASAARQEIAARLLVIFAAKLKRKGWMDLAATINSLDDTLDEGEVLTMLKLFTPDGVESQIAITNLPDDFRDNEYIDPFKSLTEADQKAIDRIKRKRSLSETDRIIETSKMVLSRWIARDRMNPFRGNN